MHCPSIGQCTLKLYLPELLVVRIRYSRMTSRFTSRYTYDVKDHRLEDTISLHSRTQYFMRYFVHLLRENGNDRSMDWFQNVYAQTYVLLKRS